MVVRLALRSGPQPPFLVARDITPILQKGLVQGFGVWVELRGEEVQRHGARLALKGESAAGANDNGRLGGDGVLGRCGGMAEWVSRIWQARSFSFGFG